jgi:hypothetical protein
MEYSGAQGKIIHEKPGVENFVSDSFKSVHLLYWRLSSIVINNHAYTSISKQTAETVLVFQ